MTKKIFIITGLFIISLLSTGCWNYHELNDFAIINSIGIDKKNNKYELSLLISNTSDSSSQGEVKEKTTVITGKGINITEALNDAKSKSSKDLYTGHLSLILINEEIAKESIYDIIDPIIHDPESIKKLDLVIIKGDTANEILKVLSPLDNFPSENISFNIKNSIEQIGISHNTHISNFIYKIFNEGYDNILPSISIAGSEKNNNSTDELKKIEIKQSLKIDDIAIFKKYKLVGYANIEESKAINTILNKGNLVTITTKCYKDIDKYISIKLDNPKTKISYKIDKNNKVKYFFDIKSNGVITETNCTLDLSDTKVIEKISNYAKSYYYELLKKTINKTKKLKTDIFGLGNLLYKKDNKYWKDNKKNWDDIYSKLDYKININFNLKTKGSFKTTLKDKDKGRR